MNEFFLATSKNDKRSDDLRRWRDEINAENRNDIRFVDYCLGVKGIIVGGGDGTAISSIDQYWQYDAPFLGVNRGTLGFLLNRIKTKEQFVKMLCDFDKHTFIKQRLIEAVVESESMNGSVVFFQDTYVNAERGTAVIGTIKGKKHKREIFQGDGIVVATPAGSTAYNRSAGGQIIPLDAQMFTYSSICPMTRPIGAAINFQTLEIEIVRGESITHIDHVEAINVKHLVIKPTKHYVQLGFVKGYDFASKRIYMANNHQIRDADLRRIIEENKIAGQFKK